MIKQYDSSRRKNAARQTREKILQAAMKLHWQGITEYGPLALEADCSMATLRKHFPNKEDLFQNCTRTFAGTLAMPDMNYLEDITDPAESTTECVTELCRIHEAMFGYAWLSAHERKNSPTLDTEMSGYEGLADAIAGIITPAGSSKSSLIRGLLDFLTYRALRLSGQLSPERATQELVETLQSIINVDRHFA